MPRRAVLTLAAGAVLLGGAVTPALAAPPDPFEPSQHCVLTQYDPGTGERVGVCVWLPLGSPLNLIPR
jgi:hypothetical protein